MAGDGTISSKLQLDGEQQYKKALNDAYRSLRVLRSELKAETAELGRNATQQDKARAKMQSLQKQIAEQEKIVKTLEKALADSKKEYADNQEVQDKWAEKLNKAREALANMKNSMEECEDSLGKFGDSMKDVADSSGEAMQTVISFNDALKSIGSIASGISGGISDIFSSAVDTMKDMVDEMFSLMSMAWSAAGDWKDIQAVWGGDLEEIQRVYKGMEMQGVDASTVTGAMQKLVANVHGGSDGVEAAMRELGFSESQFTSHFEMFQKIMDRLSTEYYTRGKRHDLAAALFGEKKGSDVLLMLDKWNAGMTQYHENIEEPGLVVHSDEIDELELVGQKIQNIQTTWDAIKTNVGAKLSDVLNMDQLTDDTLEILRDIGAILNSEGETRAELTLKLTDDIEKLFEDLGAAMENLGGFLQELGGDLKNSDNPLVRFIGQLIEGLGGILDWLGENGGTIIEWLNRLLPLIAGNKVLETVTGKGAGDWATDLLKLGIDVSILTKMGKVLGAGAGAAMTAEAATIGTTIGGGLAGTAAAFGMAAGAALLAIPGIDALLHPEKYAGEHPEEVKKIGEISNPGDILTIPDNGSAAAKETFNYLLGLPTGGSRKEEVANAPGVEEFEELPEGPVIMASPEEQDDAIQKWWDAMRDATNGAGTWDAEAEAYAKMQDIFGDAAEDIMDAVLLKIDEETEPWEVQDIPSTWYADVTGALKNLVGASVENAVKGTKFSIIVNLDGEKVAERTNVALGSMLSYLNG